MIDETTAVSMLYSEGLHDAARNLPHNTRILSGPVNDDMQDIEKSG